MICERAENGRRYPGPIGHLLNGDLGLVAAIRNAAYNLMFHDLVFINQQGSRGIVKARPNVHANSMVHRQLDRARLQYPGALRCHLQHLFIGDFSELASFRNDTRIAGIDTVNIREDVAAIGAERCRQRHRRGIGAAAAERRDPTVRPDPLKPGHDGNLPPGQAPSKPGDVDLLDACLAMYPVGAEWNLPTEPRARVDLEVLKCQREQARGHLLAGGDNDVILACVMHAA